MKSLVLAIYYLTVALGQVLDIILMLLLPSIVKSRGQIWEFSIFAVIMLIDMVVLALLSRKYTYSEDLNKQ